MRIFGRLLLILILIISLTAIIYAAQPAGEGGGEKAATDGGDGEDLDARPRTLKRATGPGTEPIYFDDNTLLFDPVPTMTPIIYFPKLEKEAWDNLQDTKHLVVRINTDAKRYEKEFRKKMDKNLLEMGKATASFHTKALLHDRDKLEYIWEKQVKKTMSDLEVARMQVDEFHEDYRTMLNNQKRVLEILSKYSHKLQRTEELDKKFEMNEKEIYFAEKTVAKFTDLFNVFVAKFNRESERKEGHIKKLVLEHEALHKP